LASKFKICCNRQWSINLLCYVGDADKGGVVGVDYGAILFVLKYRKVGILSFCQLPLVDIINFDANLGHCN
jgi:hypothetical protein